MRHKAPKLLVKYPQVQQNLHACNRKMRDARVKVNNKWLEIMGTQVGHELRQKVRPKDLENTPERGV